jgi:hypothetical protein
VADPTDFGKARCGYTPVHFDLERPVQAGQETLPADNVQRAGRNHCGYTQGIMRNEDRPGFSGHFDPFGNRKNGAAKERAPYFVVTHSQCSFAFSKFYT